MDQGIGQVHGSMVDRGAYPFASSNRGHRCWIRRMGKKEDGATMVVGDTAGLHDGGVTGDRPEWRFGALKLAVRSQGGVGEDGEASGDVGEALEGRR
jgi:hypothetical protein